MQVKPLSIPEVLLACPAINKDSRGYFYEIFHDMRYKDAGIGVGWTQDNVSKTGRGIIRGLHFQWPKPQGKLVTAIAGSVFDVAVDVRLDSPSFGKWVGVELNDIDCNQLWIPDGFAHGFQAMSDGAVISYKCAGNYWSPDNEQVIRYDDPDIGIKWPLPAPFTNHRDGDAPYLKDCDNFPIIDDLR